MPPGEDDTPSCAQAGVLGAAVAVVAGHVARAALDLAAGDVRRGGELLVFDDLVTDPRPRPVRFARRSDCPACRHRPQAAPARSSS
jgi:molybdopterin/thiamine biosynthesis adenylyltransferase